MTLFEKLTLSFFAIIVVCGGTALVLFISLYLEIMGGGGNRGALRAEWTNSVDKEKIAKVREIEKDARERQHEVRAGFFEVREPFRAGLYSDPMKVSLDRVTNAHKNRQRAWQIFFECIQEVKKQLSAAEFMGYTETISRYRSGEYGCPRPGRRL